jgi:hypothetical protein
MYTSSLRSNSIISLVIINLFIWSPIRVVPVVLVSSRRALHDSTKVFMSRVFLYIVKYYINKYVYTSFIIKSNLDYIPTVL